MAKTAERDKTKVALVTEKNASNNPHLDKVVESINNTYRSTRSSGQNLSLRKHRVGMTLNDKPIWAYKKDENGKVIGTKLLFGASWYLSAEEVYLKEELLKDPETLRMNESFWDAMERQGLPVEKIPGTNEVRVVSGLE